MYQKVLVAVDGSDNALRAVREAVRLTEGNAHAAITLITAVPPVDPLLIYGPWITVQQVKDAEKNATDIALQKSQAVISQETEAIALVKGIGLKVENVIQMGDPAQAIIEYAAKEECDVIVMGRRGLGTLKGLLLGSVSSKVLQLAPCPVLLVR